MHPCTWSLPCQTPPVHTSNQHIRPHFQPLILVTSSHHWDGQSLAPLSRSRTISFVGPYFLHLISFSFVLLFHVAPLCGKQYRIAALPLFGRLPNAFSSALTFKHCHHIAKDRHDINTHSQLKTLLHVTPCRALGHEFHAHDVWHISGQHHTGLLSLCLKTSLVDLYAGLCWLLLSHIYLVQPHDSNRL